MTLRLWMIVFTLGVAGVIAALIYTTRKHHQEDRRDDYS